MEKPLYVFDVATVRPGSRVPAEIPFYGARVLYRNNIFVVGEAFITQGTYKLVNEW